MTLEDTVLARRVFVMRRAQELANVTAACEQLGISRTLFYRWRQRFLRYGADGLKPRPPRRARPGQQAPAAVEAAVLGYSQLWPTHGPARIAAQLTRPGGPVEHLSASGAYAILKPGIGSWGPVSESGRLRQGAGGPLRGDRPQSVLMLTTLRMRASLKRVTRILVESAPEPSISSLVFPQPARSPMPQRSSPRRNG